MSDTQTHELTLDQILTYLGEQAHDVFYNYTDGNVRDETRVLLKWLLETNWLVISNDEMAAEAISGIMVIAPGEQGQRSIERLLDLTTRLVTYLSYSGVYGKVRDQVVEGMTSLQYSSCISALLIDKMPKQTTSPQGQSSESRFNSGRKRSYSELLRTEPWLLTVLLLMRTNVLRNLNVNATPRRGPATA